MICSSMSLGRENFWERTISIVFSERSVREFFHTERTFWINSIIICKNKLRQKHLLWGIRGLFIAFLQGICGGNGRRYRIFLTLFRWKNRVFYLLKCSICLILMDNCVFLFEREIWTFVFILYLKSFFLSLKHFWGFW